MPAEIQDLICEIVLLFQIDGWADMYQYIRMLEV